MTFNVGKLRKNVIVFLASLSMAVSGAQARFSSLSTLFNALAIPLELGSGAACIFGAKEMHEEYSDNLVMPLYGVGAVNIFKGVASLPNAVQSWQTNTLLNDSDKKKEMEKKFGNSQPGMYPGNTSMPSPYMQNPMGQSNMNMGTYLMPGYGAQNNAGNPGAYINPNGTFRR